MATSASDKVQLTYKPETALGVIVTAGNMIPVRMKSESMSGSPNVSESEEITADGQPTGQNILGLTVGGAVSAELAPTVCHQDFIEAGMKSAWGGSITTGVQTLTIDVTAKTITRLVGDYGADGFKVGDMIALTAFANAENNVLVRITALSPTVITYAGDSGMIAETGTGSEVITRPEYVDWGQRFGGKIDSGLQTLIVDTTAKTVTRSVGDFTSDGFAVGDLVQLSGFANHKNNTTVLITAVVALAITYDGASTMLDETGTGSEKVILPEYSNNSFTLAKDFTDLTDKSLTYAGERVGQFKLGFQYGAIATAEFTMVGAGYDVPAVPFTTGKAIDAVGTEAALNASSDLGLVVVDGAQTTYCIKGMDVDVNNNIQAVECMGALAPKDQQATGLSVGISMNAYLQDANFDFHKNKLTQTPVAISYYVRDENGQGYAVDLPAVQFTFDDAGASGRRQLNELSLTGVAKKDGTLGRTIRIYKL